MGRPRTHPYQLRINLTEDQHTAVHRLAEHMGTNLSEAARMMIEFAAGKISYDEASAGVEVVGVVVDQEQEQVDRRAAG